MAEPNGTGRREFLRSAVAIATLAGVGGTATATDHGGGRAFGADGFGTGGYGGVAVPQKPIGESDSVPTDPDGDGLYEDVDGDGVVDARDALAYYRNRNVDTIRRHPEWFDFDGDGTAGTVFDAVTLYRG